MFSGRGRLLLFADADAATRFSDVDKLENQMHQINKKDVSIIYYILLTKHERLYSSNLKYFNSQ